VEAGFVAEGIETRGELAALRAMGAGSGQGYYLGNPGPPGRVATERFPPGH
jgi:EAL domain-containing protein (putative c-di-GMP-specific phosphodiesterase class I)